MNKNGVSMVALVITMIVIIILAGITYNMSFSNVTEAQKTSFLNDLEKAVYYLRAYNTRGQAAYLMGAEGAEKNYDPNNLQWDGISERAENTAKMEDGINEDSVEYIFEKDITNNIKGKIKIKDGQLYVSNNYPTEFEWASEYYDYMKSGE
jgi:Tfp pilus assembly protein PilE